jgi:hypothetical protein
VFINLLLLMAIVFLPFSTAELGANILVPRDANTVALLYALNAFVIAVGVSAVWTYALKHPGLLAPDVDREVAIAILAPLHRRHSRLPGLRAAQPVQPDRGSLRLRGSRRLLRVRGCPTSCASRRCIDPYPYCMGNGSCHQDGSSSIVIEVTHFTHQ